MAIEIQLSRPIKSDAAAGDLVETLRNESAALGLDDAILYYGYPRYRDDDDELIAAQILLMSPNHGIVIFGTMNSARPSAEEKRTAEQAAESVLALVHSKLLANKALRSSPIGLRFPVTGYIYSPNLTDVVQPADGLEYVNSHAVVRTALSNFSPCRRGRLRPAHGKY